MDLKWLDDFRALARTRHFSRAADEQNVTQPTFSRRIKMLEEDVGVMLVDRNTLPLSLTPAGRLFLDASERISRDLRETRELCLDLEHAESEKLRFATNQTLYLSFYSDWIEQLQAETELVIDLNSTAWVGGDFVNALQQGECDLVLCYWHPAIDFLRPLEGREYLCCTLAQERLVPVTATDNAGQPRFQLPGSDAAPLPYIGYNGNTFLNPVITDHLRRVSVPPHLLQVNQNSQAISVKAMIAQGFGIGWLPQRLLDQDGEQGLLPAGDARWTIPLELRLYRLADASSPQLDKLWQQIVGQQVVDSKVDPQNVAPQQAAQPLVGQ